MSNFRLIFIPCGSIYYLQSLSSYYLRKTMAKKEINPIEIYECSFCKREIKSRVPNRKFCSKECRKMLEIKQSNEKWVERDLDKRPKYKFGELRKVSGWRKVL